MSEKQASKNDPNRNYYMTRVFTLEMKIQFDNLNRELLDYKLDNEKCREKIQELEKWIVLLLNNFYSGNPQSLESIQLGL